MGPHILHKVVQRYSRSGMLIADDPEDAIVETQLLNPQNLSLRKSQSARSQTLWKGHRKLYPRNVSLRNLLLRY